MAGIPHIALILALTALPCLAETVSVQTREELSVALQDLQAGTTIQLASGEWSDLDITIKAKGSPGAPVVIEATEPGRVLITGRSTLVLDGEYIIVRGLYFKETILAKGAEALISFRNKDKEESSNCRISQIFFEDCNPEDLLTNYPWIRMYGHNNRIDHCRFTGQEHKGRAIQVRVYEPDPGHRIDHNYFSDRPPGLESNGYEIIQIGLSSDSMKPGNVVVEENIFARCDGETEIISSKSWANIIRNNLFLECSGTVTLRHGQYSVVENNAFIGNGKESCGGVRVIDKGHKIRGNYFSGLSGRTGGVVVLYCGIPGSPLKGYFSADNAVLKDNIFHDNSGNAIHLTGGFGDRNRVLLPAKACVADNVFGRPTSGGAIAITGNLPDVELKGNHYQPGTERGYTFQEEFHPENITFIANQQGLFEPHLVRDGIIEDTPIKKAPRVPKASEVGPDWAPVLPDFLLLNESH